MTGLSRLTLVMPTYCRQQYALRAIKFWSNTDINLIVIDGSPKPIDANIVRKLPLNIEYIWNQASWTNRMRLGAERVSTEFSSLICDDEFYLPSSLRKSIEVLDKNHDVVSAIGHVIRFYPHKRSIYFQYSYPEFTSAAVFDNHPIQRVRRHLHPYRVLSLYAVIRSTVFKRNIAVAETCSKLPDSTFFEVGFEIANAFQGNITVLPLISWLRSNENPPIWNNKRVSIYEWWEQEKDNELFSQIAIAVEKILNPKILQNVEVRKTILYQGFEAYYRNQNHVEVSKIKKNILKARKRIRNIISNDFVFACKMQLAKLGFREKDWLVCDDLTEILNSRDLHVDFSEIRIVSKHILETV